MAGGPRQVQAACEAALGSLGAAFTDSAVTGSREQWAGAVAALQRVIDVASAAQDAAIVRLAAIEAEPAEDGTVRESHRGSGHVALDAPAIVSGVLASSVVHAERRVRTAVLLAADGPAGTATDTGLGELHAAMAAGRLDPYRADVLAQELQHAPAPVRAAVVVALDQHLAGEDAAHLRRRCRRALARISPDLLRQRAVRARSESGLRRWVEEPGVDRWEGTFPSEDAARAWAAIDALARRYLTEQLCPTIERARAKALTDLVAGNATIDTVITLTVPATALPHDPTTAPGERTQQPTTAPEEAAEPPQEPTPSQDRSPVRDGDLVEVTGLHGSQPVLVSRQWLTDTIDTPPFLQTAECHPITGALQDDQREPRSTTGQTGADTGRDASLAGATPDARRVAGADAADRYRPAPRLAARVRARDRRCRFPGCTVAAVFCDLDHVRPWPHGRTSLANLLCLCRRHHRIKQRPGWRVVLAPDGTATWTDPTDRVRTTEPVDALHGTLLHGEPGTTDTTDALDTPDNTGTSRKRNAPAPTPSRPRTVVPDGPHSELEFLLEHLGAGPPRPPATRRRRHGRRLVELVPQHACLLFDAAGHRLRRPGATGRFCDTDQPPF